jgi:hypothetical protein
VREEVMPGGRAPEYIRLNPQALGNREAEELMSTGEFEGAFSGPHLDGD